MLINTRASKPDTYTIPKAPRSWSPIVVGGMCVAYLLAMIVVAALLWTLSDRWWPATVLLFAPRWMLALPLALLVPVATVFHRRSLVTLGICSIVLVLPVLGYCFSVDGTSSGKPEGALRVLNCNVHRQQLNADAFRQLIESSSPDVIALQDWSSIHEGSLFADPGWHTRRDGELFIASRYPIVGAVQLLSPPTEQPGFKVRYGAATSYQLMTPDGPITLVNLHLASPHEALQAMRDGDPSFAEQLSFNSQQREIESAAVSDYLDTLSGPVVVAGDFNMPRESPIFRSHFGHLTNAFSRKGRGFGVTHVSTASSVRIDHVLVTGGLDVRECRLADAAGSPHRPMVTDLVPDRSAHLQTTSSEP